MLRTHTCGELRAKNIHEHVTLVGWVHRLRDKGSLFWIDLRDGYGLIQLFLEEGKTDPKLFNQARQLGREFVIQVAGQVIERQSKNDKLNTGDIEIEVNALKVINRSKTPPFTLEENSDGGDDLRMTYRYLDLRRAPLQQNLRLRHQLARETRRFLENHGFLEIETPMLIKSTPEGARDFVVPSRLNQGNFYALPQSPQTFKQLLVLSGFDRYYQFAKCFRDEDFRADRQPEFTQIDCEMAFVEQKDVLNIFENLIIHLFKEIKGVDIPPLTRITYEDALKHYGSDKPDIRFDMRLTSLEEGARGKGFSFFDKADSIIGLCVKGCASYTRKQLDKLAGLIKTSQSTSNISPLVYVRYHADGFLKSSVDKFYGPDELKKWAMAMKASPGDLMLVFAGNQDTTYKSMGALRLHLGNELNLQKEMSYAALWVVDFPLLEWDDESHRFYAKHHPFTSPKSEDIPLLQKHPELVRANAYDLVINGIEIGGGSIRIHDNALQHTMFEKLGLTPGQIAVQFGFLTDAFKHGAPPHGGIALGLDRLCALFGGSDSIRDFIAFPKNNAGRDMMVNSPSPISEVQLRELGIRLREKRQ